jgi:hypothetical protein
MIFPQFSYRTSNPNLPPREFFFFLFLFLLNVFIMVGLAQTFQSRYYGRPQTSTAVIILVLLHIAQKQKSK